jgi:hypothetical protein
MNKLQLATIFIVATIASSCSTLRPNARCADIPGADEIGKPGHVVIFSEMHGTHESPRFAGDVLFQFARRNAIVLALELPGSANDALTRFMNSLGDSASRAAFLAMPLWNAQQQDGKRSVAMVALIERARQMRADGLDVTAIFFDDDTKRGNARDSAMSQTVTAALARKPNAVGVVVAGNIHGRMIRGLPWDERFMPFGLNLANALNGRITSLVMRHTGGTAWICAEEGGCRPRDVKDNANGTSVGIRMTRVEDGGFHGSYNVGRVTAAPPAVQK